MNLEATLETPSTQVDDARYVLDVNRVYIFPTRHGWMFGTMLTVMLFGSTNYNNSVAFMLTFLLGGIGLACIMHTYRNLAGLVFVGGRATQVFAGEVVEFLLKLDNRGHPARFAVAFSPWPKLSGRARRRYAKSNPPEVVSDVQADAMQTLRLALPAPRRGLQALGRFRLETYFPLGLLRAWAYIDTDITAIVYPHPQGNAPLPYNPDETRYQIGGQQNGVDDFVGFRRYRSGDSPRSIAWKAAARGLGLLTKRFTGSGSSAVWLQWSDSASAGGTETRVSQLTRWVLQADSDGLQYGLRLPGLEVPRDNGAAHRHRCLHALAVFGAP